MDKLPVTSVFNDGHIAGLHESFLNDPASVDESWRQFFRLAHRLAGPSGIPSTTEQPPADASYLRKVAGAAGLVQAIREYGHLAVQLDPLGSSPMGAGELRPEFHGIAESDLASIPAAALGFEENGTAADVVAKLREIYSSTIGFEFEHIEEDAERQWFRQVIEKEEMQRSLSPEQNRALLRRLTQVDGLERFLGRAYQGYKRFSIEGTDALVPMLDAAIEHVPSDGNGAREVVIGMAHRGRINVLAHILDKPYSTIFQEFEGKHAVTNAASDTGDVKYHLGARTERKLADGTTVGVMLVPNPSHLEFVNPVVEGVARALQRVSDAKPGTFDESVVLPVLVHGDAAFPGEGVVAETFNLSYLRGYRTGGTLHIIANNQVGFTTDPRDGRSTYYASDLAKGFEVPIVHVNADDAVSCIAVVWLALSYRAKFGKDFLIDLVGYRRHGHNETDEPAYTQPKLYSVIRTHPTPREVHGQRLVSQGLIDASEVKRIEAEVMTELERAHGDLSSEEMSQVDVALTEEEERRPGPQPDTKVQKEQLVALNERILTWPADFRPMPKLAKQLERRRAALTETRDTALGERGSIDWGHAESLAFASLLAEGISVRLTGQDTERGTFSHRQAVLHDHESGATYTPLQHVPGVSASFEIYNSPLSETAVLGFEYGYNVAAEDSLVLWEAQFGDFVNVAQPIIDQFITADRAKWKQDSGVVLLLPHGYEGQGPEHSSARVERFLQSCAEDNMRVAYPSTPAQYFHILRRQAKNPDRRPLVLMQPKSLLRLAEAASRLRDLATGSFEPVIDDPVAARRREQVRRVVFCSGKIYYDLAMQKPQSHIALVRVEELYPWPHDAVAAILDRYSGVTEVVWVQEEPKNMGAWTFVSPRLRAAAGNAMTVRYVGRPERASPAEGYAATHQQNQSRIVSEALAPMTGTAPEKRRSKTGQTGQTGLGVRG